MVPTPIACSIEDSINTISVSGRGPSSRIEPASTKGTWPCTQAWKMPCCSTPCATAAASPPQRRILLIAWR
jgi:hypothetical protein